MHKCSKCGHAASSLEEIDAGCPCGSKVFVFDRQIAQAATAAEGDGGAAGGDGGAAAAADGNGGNGSPPAANAGAAPIFAVPGAQEGKVPESYFARMTFTNDDIENIKVLTQGVFLLDVNAISKNPVVLKDEDEIYYVKLPLVQKKAPEPGNGGNGGNNGNGEKE